MKITIQTISGTNRTIEVEPTSTIRSIKEQLFALEGITADQQRILFHGQILQDVATIESSQVEEGAVLHMVLQLRGGF